MVQLADLLHGSTLESGILCFHTSVRPRDQAVPYRNHFREPICWLNFTILLKRSVDLIMQVIECLIIVMLARIDLSTELSQLVTKVDIYFLPVLVDG